MILKSYHAWRSLKTPRKIIIRSSIIIKWIIDAKCKVKLFILACSVDIDFDIKVFLHVSTSP
jgi:hypothetical protein